MKKDMSCTSEEVSDQVEQTLRSQISFLERNMEIIAALCEVTHFCLDEGTDAAGIPMKDAQNLVAAMQKLSREHKTSYWYAVASC